MTLRLPSGENLAPPARIRRLETGRSGKEERGGGVEGGSKNSEEIAEMQAWDKEDGGMSCCCT